MKNEHLQLAHPHNLKLTNEERIEHLKIAILFLKDHMKKFAKEIKIDNPTAYKFITNEVINMQRELKIRIDYLVPEALKLSILNQVLKTNRNLERIYPIIVEH